MTVPAFLQSPPRFFFFTGKGGVGKTTISGATALHLVESGKRVLLVSTDPASNIGQVFGQEIGNRIVGIDSVPGLHAMEIDPQQAVEQYRERIIGPMRGMVPEAEFSAVSEQLSGACTTEIASFNEFTNLLTDDPRVADFDHIIFDTAPTGHTIRLLSLPSAWNDFLTRGRGDASCLGPVSGLEKQKEAYAAAVDALADSSRTRLVLVARAQESSLNEIARTHHELADIGFSRQHVVVNGVLPEPAAEDPLAAAIYAREQAALAEMPAILTNLPRDEIALQGEDMVGTRALGNLFRPAIDVASNAIITGADVSAPGLGILVDELAQDDAGLVMVMGKGGVGKTTIASAIAVALAKAGKNVHLTTTDPAAHLTSTLAGEVPGLTVSRIDPEKELERYKDQVLRTRGASLSPEDRTLLEEDLRSPCYEEIAVFQAFSKSIRASRRSFVVVDTAPTGHTLLLMDTTGAYHHEVARSMGGQKAFSTPLMDLQNADRTKIIITTLAETTPVLEAENLEADLARAEIQPWAWVVNSSLAAARPVSPLLAKRAKGEGPLIQRVASNASGRFAVVPMLRKSPVGKTALESLSREEIPAR